MSLIGVIAPYIAVIIFAVLLQYAAKRNQRIEKIVEKADMLLNKTIFGLSIFVVNMTLWLGVVMVAEFVFSGIAFYVNPEFVQSLLHKDGVIIGELMFIGTLIVSGILTIVKPLASASKISEAKIQNICPARE
ncbi:MAG: hypothetical protein Q8N37_04025 [bacterium]|nr:hypothetical protein [bacterium]